MSVLNHEPGNPAGGGTAERLRATVREDLDILRRRMHGLAADLEAVDRRAASLVEHRPFLALGVAIGVGYLVGRILRHG